MSIKKIVDFCFGRMPIAKHKGKPLLERPSLYCEVPKESVLKRFGVDYDQMCWVLNVIRIVLREKFSYEAEIHFAVRSNYQLKFYEEVKDDSELSRDNYYQFIKKNSNRIKLGFSGSMTDLCNNLGENIDVLTAKVENIAKTNNGSLSSDDATFIVVKRFDLESNEYS